MLKYLLRRGPFTLYLIYRDVSPVTISRTYSVIVYVDTSRPTSYREVSMGQNQSSKTHGGSHAPASNYAAKSQSTSQHGHKKPSTRTSSLSNRSRGQKDKPRTKYEYAEGQQEERSYSTSYPRWSNEQQGGRATTVGSGYSERHSRQFPMPRQTSSGSSSVPAKVVQIERYFTKYKDVADDAILAEGMEKFCIDLGVDPTEFVVLLLAWKFEASQMCRFTREEFLNGCKKLRAHDSKSLKERFPELVVEVQEEKNFKELYNFTFTFGLDHMTGQRSLPIDMAIPLWELVFTQNRPPILDRWFDFLKNSEARGISRDTWNMFLPFCNQIRKDMSNYDESEAWPSLFDDFVEHEISKQS